MDVSSASEEALIIIDGLFNLGHLSDAVCSSRYNSNNWLLAAFSLGQSAVLSFNVMSYYYYSFMVDKRCIN